MKFSDLLINLRYKIEQFQAVPLIAEHIPLVKQ